MEDFSGPWLGIGILIGFVLGAALAVWATIKWRSKSVWETDNRVWQPPKPVTTFATTPAKIGLPETRRMDTDTMGDTRKSIIGPLQAAQQSLHIGVNEVVVNMPDTASTRVNSNAPTANVYVNAAPSTHKRGVSTASVYDVDNLDDDWTSLLDSVDEMLIGLGHTAMTAGERPVAVRRLVSATSTRGMDGAVKAAVEEVIRFRSWNNTGAARA